MGLFDWLGGKDRGRKPVRTLGLALGGGGVRGAAHLGVLDVLEREGIRPDVIAGTSVGSIIGACLAAGLDVGEMRETMRTLKWTDLTRLSWGNRLALLDTTPLRRFIDRSLGEREFDDLEVPFAAVTCDVLTGAEVLVREGSVARAVTASSALPGLFPPDEYGEALLIDGGAIANLPVRAARELGADYVIAVDIVPEPDGTRRPEDVKDVLLMAFDIFIQSNQSLDEAEAECTISPVLAGMPPWDFDLVDQMVALGRSAAEEALPQLRADLRERLEGVAR